MSRPTKRKGTDAARRTPCESIPTAVEACESQPHVLVMRGAQGPVHHCNLDHRSELVIGRDGSCDVVVTDPFCDPRHVRLYVGEDGTWYCQDLDSTNGVKINGKPIVADERISAGDRIELGVDTVFLVQAAGASQPGSGLANTGSPAGEVLTWVPEVKVDGVRPGPTLKEKDFDSSKVRKASLDHLPVENLYVLMTTLYEQACNLREQHDVSCLAETALKGLLAMSGADVAAVYRRNPKSGKLGAKITVLGGTLERADMQKLARRVARTRLTVWQPLEPSSTAPSGSPGAAGRMRGGSIIASPVEWDIPVAPKNRDRKEWNRELVGFLFLAGSRLTPREVDLAALIAKMYATTSHTLHNRAQERRELVDAALPQLSMFGDSRAMARVKETAIQVASSRVSILIQGETGTGKDVLANEIHRLSGRKGRFVAVNCAAIPQSMIESEIFGHKKGAFTDASYDRAGVFEQAHQGTLFLDEIGDMPLDVQTKLLRVLETHEVTRVGDTDPIQVDVRVLAATNHDLAQLGEKDRFRQDLFYRLCVVVLELPPLRERKDEIPGLVRRFIDHLPRPSSRQAPLRFADDAMKLLVAYDWPGNVRELKNFVERIVALTPASGQVVTAEEVERSLADMPDLSANGDEAAPLDFKMSQAVHDLSYYAEQMRISKNQEAAAKAIGVSARTLSRHIRNLFEKFPDLAADPRFEILRSRKRRSRKR